MKISKDILQHLHIETVYIVTSDNLYLCCPIEILKDRWSVACDSDNLEGKVRLKVKYHGSFIYLDSVITKKSQENLYSFTYEVVIDEEEWAKDRLKETFFRELQKIQEQTEGWNRRKEERYDIGLDEKRQKLINFKTTEQTLISDKTQLPCLVNNISFSGAKITTLEGNFSKDKKVCLNLSFVQPIEQIPLIGTIKSCVIKSTLEKKIVSILSLHFDVSPIEFKKRLDRFIKLLNGENL